MILPKRWGHQTRIGGSCRCNKGLKYWRPCHRPRRPPRNFRQGFRGTSTRKKRRLSNSGTRQQEGSTFHKPGRKRGASDRKISMLASTGARRGSNCIRNEGLISGGV